jgi:pyruvate kinase
MATCQQLQFSSGVYPILEPEHPEQWKTYVRRWVTELGIGGELVVLTEGPSTKHPETNHRMEIIDLRPGAFTTETQRGKAATKSA